MAVARNPLSSAPVHFSLPLRVYWEDTDAGGIVFYGNYLKLMERARTDWLRSLGFSQEAFRTQGQGVFVVTDTRLRYLQPARLDDELMVTVALVEQGRATLVFSQTVCRGSNILCEGDIRVGWVRPDAEGRLRPGRLPEAVAAVLPAPVAHNPTHGGEAPQPVASTVGKVS